MGEYIEKQAVLDRIEEWNIVSFYELNEHSKEAYQEIKLAISSLPSADVVPWEVLERYADWFCALVPYPEFVREAKAFYNSTRTAMEGGASDE